MIPESLEARALALARRKGLLETPPRPGEGLASAIGDADLRDRLLWEALQEDATAEGATYPASWTGGVWPPPLAPEPGFHRERFGPYESLELLGAGGQGRVYRAFDPRLRREVALKLLQGARPEEHLREARAQAQVEHRNVCRIYEVGEVEGQPYLAMQLIQGRPLAAWRRDPKEAVRLLRDAAEGVHAAHRQGLLHLDLKPSNLLVAETEAGPTLFVTDFGLAGTEAEGGTRPLGSPPFCAPEQVDRGRAPLDPRADVYGLGATLFTVLTGQLPFQADSLTELVDAIQRQAPPRLRAADPALPRDLEAILLKAMAKDPADRYASALAFADDLDRWLKGMPIAARATRWPGRGMKWARRNPLTAASLGLLLAGGLAAGAWSARNAARHRRMRALLQTFSEDMRTLELRLFAMRMLPPEDQRPIRADLRQRLQRIEAALPEMGDLAPAGHYALGIGYRSLREWEPSARHFKAAWDAGFRTPESAEATGIAFGILTTVLTQQADALPPPARAEAEARIQREWGDPGRRILSTYAGTPLETPYAAALGAYHRKDFDAVFRHCLDAVHRQPWQVAAWRFMVSCAMEDPAAAARAGLSPGADGYSLAVRRLELTGPGDSVSQDVLGAYWAQAAEAAPAGSAERHVRFERAFAAFGRARVIDPDDTYPLQRILGLCEDAAEAEPAHRSAWRASRARLLAEAAREPALAEAVKAAQAGN